MKKPETPLDCYMRHIAHANIIILNEVLNDIHKTHSDET